MKGGEDHEVPLGQRVLDILQPLYETRSSKYVFPGERPGRRLSSAAMDALLTRMGEDAYTVHGFRSSFRGVGEIINFRRDLAEIALAHKVGDETEQAFSLEYESQVTDDNREAFDATCSNGTSLPAPAQRASLPSS